MTIKRMRALPTIAALGLVLLGAWLFMRGDSGAGVRGGSPAIPATTVTESSNSSSPGGGARTPPDHADTEGSGAGRRIAASSTQQGNHADSQNDGAGTAPPADDGPALLDFLVLDARNGAPVSGASLLMTRVASAPEVVLASEHQARTDSNGRAQWSDLAQGTYQLTVSSERHQRASRSVVVDSRRVVLPPIELEPLPAATVKLLGAEREDATAYEVARFGRGLRVSFDANGETSLPWPDDALPELTIHAPDDVEISALFGDLEAADEPMSVRIAGGEALDVNVVGEFDEARTLVLCLQFNSSLGYSAFVTTPVALGSTKSFTLCEVGDAWLDVGVNRDDRTLATLARASVRISEGRPTSVTVDLGRERTWARFESGPGVRVLHGELYFAVAGESPLSPAGGALDERGRVLVPAQAEREFFVIGVTGPPGAPVVAADVQVHLDTRAGGEMVVALGDVVESEVHLVDAITGAPLTGRRCDLIGGSTRQFAAEVFTGQDGAPARVRWHARGTPCVELFWTDVWSPRQPVALTAGDVRVAVLRRAECTFRAPGALVTDVRHVAMGLDGAGLRADAGVHIEPVADGLHCRGIPSGVYQVRLQGDEVWRGPYAVAPGLPSIIDVVRD